MELVHGLINVAAVESEAVHEPELISWVILKSLGFNTYSFGAMETHE